MDTTRDGIRILHVDDESNFTDLAAAHIEGGDDRFQVETAPTASDGLDLLATTDFDCVVSDYEMPGLSGIEFLEAVRADYPDLPFVLFTGRGSEDIASDAISAGVTDYLQKQPGVDQFELLANRVSNAVQSRRNEREAERTRTQLQAISEHSADAIVTIDSDSRIHFANPAVEDVFGYDPDELVGEPLTALQPERYHDLHVAAVEEFLATGEPTMDWSNVEFPARHRDGTEFPISVSFGAFEQDGDTRFIGIMRDCSGQRDTETPVQNRGQGASTHYRDVFEKADVAISITIPETGTLGEVNPAFAELLGYDPETLRDMTIESISADDPAFDQAAAMTRIRQALDGEAQQFDWLLERADGTHVWSEVALKRTTIGGEVRMLAFVRDITDRKQREVDLEFFEELVETIGVGVAAYGDDGVLEYVNEAYATVLGTDKETLEGTRVWDVNPGLERERFDEFWQSFDEGETRTTETVHAYEGTEVLVETVTTCTELDDTRYHFGTVQDITERTAKDERFQAFVEQSNDIITVLDSAGTYQYQSPSVERILGYEPGELVGENAFDYVHPDDRESVLEAFQAVNEDPSESLVTEYRFRHGDGSWRWLESRGSSQGDESAVDGFVVNSRDVSERKTHAEQVAALHDATREMVQATDEPSVCSVAMETANTILDHSLAGIWLRDDDGERLEPVAMTERSEELFEEPPVYTEGDSVSWRAYADGETRVIRDAQNEPQRYNPDTPVRSELVIPLGDYGVLNIGSLEPDAFSESDVLLAKLLSANTQVALGRAERERRLERQTDQMEFFNSILRHDVLNAVTVIKSRGEFLVADLDDDQLQDAETIVRWADDVQEIVQRVRTVLETLTGGSDQDLRRVDLGEQLRDELERVQLTYPDVEFEVDIPDEVAVQANELLGDVLGNVVTNSVDHNDTAGLRVSVTVERDGEDVFVRVADNGSGVDDDRKEAVFRRDETGHAKSVGSGFGLFFVDAMVAKYGGDVWVEDNDAGGATVVMQFSSAA